MKKSKIVWIVIAVIVALLVGILIGRSMSIRATEEDDEVVSQENQGFKMIRINEDLSKDGKIENLQGVRWNNANIMQMDGKIEIDIMINNESETEEVPSKELTVNLLDKKGKTILTKDVTMGKIEKNYGYTVLNLEFDSKNIVIIHDIQIIAK